MPSKNKKTGLSSKAAKKKIDWRAEHLKRLDDLDALTSMEKRERFALTYGKKRDERYALTYGRKPVNRPSVKRATLNLNYLPPPSCHSINACDDNNCHLCERQRKKEYVKLPKYYTGLRVSVSGIGAGRKIATILNLPDGPPEGHLAICLDVPVDPDISDYELTMLTGSGYGRFVPKDRVRILEDQSTFAAFQHVPLHVGVVIIGDGRVDHVDFKVGQTGRLVMQPNGSEPRLMVNWSHPNKNFYDVGQRFDAKQQGVPQGRYTNCWQVPRNILAFCRMDGMNRAIAYWPNSEERGDDSPWEKGDFLRMLIAEPQRVTNGVRNFRISPGTIVRYQGRVDRSKSQVTLASGCDSAIFGIPAIISTKGLEKLEEEFIDVGGEVEITATISFRKRDLKGMKAVVILPLDQDGEVGLQFKEDIEAGSLDGHGENKRCLYVHHKAMRKISE